MFDLMLDRYPQANIDVIILKYATIQLHGQRIQKDISISRINVQAGMPSFYASDSPNHMRRVTRV